MPSPEFKPRAYGTVISVTSHSTRWAAIEDHDSIRLFKIQELVDTLETNFKKYYNDPTEDKCIDELSLFRFVVTLSSLSI
ncbi:hypothetical protein TNCV_238701 [Trichonephila clavipes]|nr:hypothetical protein TNCV_238701 [Trichonephila clavipes]